MIYTLVFDTPVQLRDKSVGKLKRIIVANGIAGQITVDPGLFGTERVVRLSDIGEATADGIRLDMTDDEWQTVSPFQVREELPMPTADALSISPTGVQAEARLAEDAPHDSYAREVTDTTHEEQARIGSVVLADDMNVIDDESGARKTLQGLVVDDGRPLELLVEGGAALSVQNVHGLDADGLHVRGSGQRPATDADRDR